MKVSRTISAACLLASFAAAQTQTATLFASDAVENGDFGSAVAVFGDRILVGASGMDRVYEFQRIADVWTEVGTIEASPAATSPFGTSIALEGDRAIIGANGAIFGGGSVHVYQWDGNDWNEEAFFADAAGDFGSAVDLSGDRFVAGSGGSVFVYELEAGVWSETAELTPAIPSSRFGETVAISGDWIAAGELFEFLFNPDPQASLFEFDGVGWTEVLAGPGSSVSFAGNRLVLGSPEGNDGFGIAVILERGPGGWVNVGSLTVPTSGAGYAESVAATGRRIYLGSPTAEMLAYFNLIAGTWSNSALLDPGFSLTDDFTTSLDACAGTVVGGAPLAGHSFAGTFKSDAGLAFVFETPWNLDFIGTGLAGTGGSAPVLDGEGCPIPGATIDVEITTGLGGAPGLLAIGLAEIAVPLFGGTLYVGATLVTVPHVLDGAFGVPFDGEATLPLMIPDVASFIGLELVMQAGYLDAGAPQSFSLSNGVALTVD